MAEKVLMVSNIYKPRSKKYQVRVFELQNEDAVVDVTDQYFEEKKGIYESDSHPYWIVAEQYTDSPLYSVRVRDTSVIQNG